MSYSLSMYWEDLKRALENYQEVRAGSKADQTSFLRQRDCLEEMYSLAMQMESKIWPLDKVKFAKKIFNIYESKFGEAEVPEIVGPKSYDFAVKVLFPHLTRSLDIHYSDILIKLGKKFGFDVNQINQHTRELMKRLNKSCEDYKKHVLGRHHHHWNLFAANQARPLEEVQNTEVAQIVKCKVS